MKQPKNVKAEMEGLSCTLSFDKSLAKNKEEMFSKKQKYIDSECMRLMDSYTPMLSGTLKSMPLIQSEIGSGLIVQDTPYAKKQYYDTRLNHRSSIRQAKWFEVMKRNHKKDILKGVERIGGDS